MEKKDLIKIDGTPSLEGYYWMSDKDYPETVNSEEGLQLNAEDNPFVVEALLKDKDKSYYIKYVDGMYYMSEYEIGNYKDMPQRIYAAHPRLSGVKGLEFVLEWEKENDAVCPEFSVLVPAGFVFMGFKK